MSGAEIRHVMCGLGEKMSTAEINILMDGLEDMHGLVSLFGPSEALVTRVSSQKPELKSKIQVKYEDFIKKLMCDDQSYETDR